VDRTTVKLRVSDKNGTGLFVDPDPSTIAYLTAPLWLFMARWMGPSRGVSVVEGALALTKAEDPPGPPRARPPEP
jgi:hypothetical protein